LDFFDEASTLDVVTNEDLKRLPSLGDLVSTLRTVFPHISPSDQALGGRRGGRIAAEAQLARVDSKSYDRSRNYLAGDVTRLSAYLRHGVLTLAEVRDELLRRVSEAHHAGKLINELAWRDYWQRVYLQIGEGVWQDREPYKTGYSADGYAIALPADISDGTTTLACIDGFARELTDTGYLHNHARMWFAAYVIHWRRIRWQAGARWFLEHLLDGDPASNNLSWQWVASTFASKAYIFNRENLERYTDGVYCRNCPHAKARTCPFDLDYEGLEQALFPRLRFAADSTVLPTPPRPIDAAIGRQRSREPAGRPLLWIHTDSLNPKSPMLLAHSDAPAVFIWDVAWLKERRIALKRIVFIAECLQEMPGRIELRSGDLAEELLLAAKACAADYILVQRTPDPRLQTAALATEQQLPVVWYDPPPFVEDVGRLELKRFSRYWQRAQISAMKRTSDNGAVMLNVFNHVER
jgi:deoxyribodipyrimidine photo-lyase